MALEVTAFDKDNRMSEPKPCGPLPLALLAHTLRGAVQSFAATRVEALTPGATAPPPLPLARPTGEGVGVRACKTLTHTLC